MKDFIVNFIEFSNIQYKMNNIKAKIIIKKSDFEAESKRLDFNHPSVLKEIYHQTHTKHNSEQITDILSSFQKIIDQTLKKIQEKQFNPLLEPRNHFVQILPPKMSQHLPYFKEYLEKWISKVCNQIFSIAFQQFLNGSMTFDQSKIYCSENILRSICLLKNQGYLCLETVKMIDQHIKNGVIKYLMKKYPHTLSTDINKPLNNIVKQMDKYKNFENDFFYNTDIVFQYRETGNYNDLIMKVVNCKIREVDQIEESVTKYKMFEDFIGNLFEKVEDEEWMDKMDKQSISLIDSRSKNIFDKNSNDCHHENDNQNRKWTAQRERYKQNVKVYTHYQIGRKISENTDIYTDKEISNMHLVIKNTSILRILTKWCEQLWQKFENKTYFLNQYQGLKVQRGGNINILSISLKDSLDQLMQQQKKIIEEFMQQLSRNNYQMQSSILTKQLQQDFQGTYIEQVEKACGIFSVKVVNNLHNYIITYLNKLIHGLLTVSNKWFDQNRSLLRQQIWPTPPNLISLKIGDLLRCKCESKQRQIINIYKHIQKISRQNPEILKVIRVKNRLKESTNDILMNVKFQQKSICQIQLSIQSQSKKSKFIEHSNLFNHYFYELKRSIFGPITELCSIWSNLDQRSLLYQELVNHTLQRNLDGHACQFQKKLANFKIFERPFICSECKVAYSHNNYIKRHLKCQRCPYWKCVKCQIDSQTKNQLLNNIIFDDNIKQFANKINKSISNVNLFPEYGFCIFMQCKIPKIQYFTKLFIKGKYYIFGQQNNKIYELAAITSTKQLNAFLSNYLVFSLPQQIGSEIIKINEQRANHEYLLVKYVKDIYQKERESLFLQQQNLNDEICQKILEGDSNEKESVKRINLESNKLTSINYICQQFPNLTVLHAEQNVIKDYSKINLLTNLENLSLGGFQVQEGQFPKQICQLSHLEVLDMHKSNIIHIPQQFGHLTRLKKIEMGNNLIEILPESICQLTNIKYLSLYSNKLKHLPKLIGQITSLEHLLLSNNELQTVPESLSQLCNLVKLDIRQNKLRQASFNFSKLTKLDYLDLSNNRLESINEHYALLQNLKSCHLNNNYLSSLPTDINWKKLINLNISNNKITKINKQLYKSKQLQKLDANHNEIYELNGQIQNLTNLKTLNVNYNKISYLPINIQYLQNLVFLSASHNKITVIPQEIGALKRLQFLYLSENCIEVIPMLLKGCFSLKQLYLNQNCIKIVPESVANLRNIQKGHLDLSYNPLERIDCPQFVMNNCDYMTKKTLQKISNLMAQNEQAVEVVNVEKLTILSSRRRSKQKRQGLTPGERRSMSSKRENT